MYEYRHMSFVNLEPGDIVYSQYAVVDTLPIKDGVNITKGHVYTVSSAGYVIALTASSGALTNLNGAVQAMASSTAVASESAGDRKAQFLLKRSRIILKAPANITPTDSVTIAATTTVVTADTVASSASGHAAKIGSVFEILTLNNRARKVATEAGDLVVVDLIE